jgi:hypothetical protein
LSPEYRGFEGKLKGDARLSTNFRAFVAPNAVFPGYTVGGRFTVAPLNIRPIHASRGGKTSNVTIWPGDARLLFSCAVVKAAN